jgi:hypothetical protein
MVLFFQAPLLVCGVLIAFPLTLLRSGRSEIRSEGDGKVAVDEARNNFDRALRKIGLALVDGANGVA